MTIPPITSPAQTHSGIAELGALRQWWAELGVGVRTIHTRDSLWRAACFEARARDSIRDGLARVAQGEVLIAAEIIAAAFGEEK
jgi:hypothetical protein